MPNLFKNRRDLRGRNGCAASPRTANFPFTQVGKVSISSSFHTLRLVTSTFLRTASNFGSKSR